MSNLKIFLASATESLEDLREVASWLEELHHEPWPWDAPTRFLPGENTFTKLIEISKQVDAAIFIFSEDDKVWYRTGTDTVGQPRDNVLIEYGLFAGALGQKRAIICRKGTPRTATDLHGIIVIDISPNRRHHARMVIKAWIENLESQKEDPAIIELLAKNDALKKELEETKEQFIFEQNKAKDLQDIVTKQGLIDFSKYDFSSDGHWKLLFDYDYFARVLSLLSSMFPSPKDWYDELIRCEVTNAISQIDWSHLKDRDRTHFYIAKTLRVFRNFAEKRYYKQFLDRTNTSVRESIDSIGGKIALSLQ